MTRKRAPTRTTKKPTKAPKPKRVAAKKAVKEKKPKKKRMPCTPPKVPISQLVGKSWEDMYNDAVVASEKRSDRSGVFHPSASGMCGRASVYCYIKAPSKNAFKAKDLDIFWMGHQLHHRVQAMMDQIARAITRSKSAGTAVFDAEFPTLPGDELLEVVGVGGTADGLFVFTVKHTQSRYLIEIKSINKDGFEKVVASGRPMESHEMQTHLYAHRFGCDQLVYFYICKDNCNIHVIEQSFNQAIFEKVVAKFDKLQDHVNAGTLPDRDEDWFSCSRCEYQTICEPVVLKRKRGFEANKKMSAARKRGFRK